jgi:hypothetical protein
MFIGLMRNREANAVTPQIRADFATALDLVAHRAIRTLRRPSSSNIRQPMSGIKCCGGAG